MQKQRVLGIIVRTLCLLLGLFILAQGIAFTVLANLGTDAITAPALVAHLAIGPTPTGMGYTFLTLGRALICVHILLVILQIILLGKQYRAIQILQVPMGMVLGSMLDICLSYTSLLPMPGYTAAIAYTLLGCAMSAFGIFTYVKSDTIPLAGEGFCLALSHTFRWRFSRVKVAVDCSMIVIAVVASLLFFGNIVGVREGSVICAVCTGYIIGWFCKVCPIWDRLFALVNGVPQNTTASDDLA